MKSSRRQFLCLAAGAGALPAVSSIAEAQTFPTRPITMTVGFAAGGTADTIARVVALGMTRFLGQNVITDIDKFAISQRTRR